MLIGLKNHTFLNLKMFHNRKDHIIELDSHLKLKQKMDLILIGKEHILNMSLVQLTLRLKYLSLNQELKDRAGLM